MSSCTSVTATGREFSDEQLKEALRIIGTATRAGKKGCWPEWVTRARRQYAREWAQAKRENDAIRRAESGEVPEAREPNHPLKDDGLIDWLAIRIAVSKSRPVRLTRNERLIAVAYMQEKLGLDGSEIGKRLDLTNIFRYTEDIKAGKVKGLLAAIKAGEIEEDGDPLEF